MQSMTRFKVVEGRSVRKYTDEDKVAETVTSIGKDPYEKKLLGITAMTTLLGKKKFNELLGDLVYKPEGKPTLVPESDKCPQKSKQQKKILMTNRRKRICQNLITQ